MTDAYQLSDAANVLADPQDVNADPASNYQPLNAVLVQPEGQAEPRAVIDPATDPRQVPPDDAEVQTASLAAEPQAEAAPSAVPQPVAPDS